MTAIRGSLQELVARLAALDEQREALRAEIASRLGMGPSPRVAQARAPRVVAASQPARPPTRHGRHDALVAMVQLGPVLAADAARRLGAPRATVFSQLNAMAARGEVVRTGDGRYGLPTTPTARRPAPSVVSSNATGEERRRLIVELARREGEVTVESAMAVWGASRDITHKALYAMQQGGVLSRVGHGRYVEGKRRKSPKQKARIAMAGEREAQVLALAAQGRISPPGIATELGINVQNAHTLLGRLCRDGKLRRVEKGIYALPTTKAPAATTEEEDEGPASDKDTDKAIALAAANGGVVTIEAVMEAGIKTKRPLAAVMLRKLHGRGRLVRIAPETYATPDQAARLKQERKAERTAVQP